MLRATAPETDATFIWFVETNSAYRNGVSIGGLDRGVIVAGKLNSTTNTSTNTNNDGPQCGIEFEPNLATTNNINITVTGGSAAGNGCTLSTTAGSGFCFFNSASTQMGIKLHGLSAISN